MDWDPLLITVAPNGARKTHKDHVALPISAAEIATEAKVCLDVGAAMMHLHVRDDNGAHTLDVDKYREAISAIEKTVGDKLVIQVTTEAVGIYTPDQQIAMVRELRPQAASVALKELSADGDKKALNFYAWAFDEGIALQHILYTPQEVSRFAYLVRHGLVPRENLSVLYVLGRYGDGQSQPSDLLPFLQAAHDDELNPKMWSVCAFGYAEGAVALTALSLGGHVRVGFENNLYLNDKSLAPNNAALVKQVADGAELIVRPLCSAQRARALMMGSGGEDERKRRDIDLPANDLTLMRDGSKDQKSLQTLQNNIGR